MVRSAGILHLIYKEALEEVNQVLRCPIFFPVELSPEIKNSCLGLFHAVSLTPFGR